MFWHLRGCADLYIVGHIFFLFLSCISFAPLETVHSIEVSDIFLPLLVVLVYSNTLSVYSSWRCFLLGLSGSGKFSLSSSIPGCWLLQEIYSVVEPICNRGTWFLKFESMLSWPRVFHCYTFSTVAIKREILLRGSLNKFPDFFCMGTFINCTRMKL